MKNIKLIFYLVLVLFITGCENVENLGNLVPPTVDQDDNLPSVKVNIAGYQRKIHVRTFGKVGNPVLFMLHGSYTDTRAYRNICEGLSDKYHVIIWDQRGCGLSERITEEEFTFESAVEEINQMKSIYSPTNKVSIIGQSWGGGLAGLYTAYHPENVAELVLIEPMPLRGEDMQKIFKTIVEFSFFNPTWNNLARHSQAITPNDHAQIDYRAMMILKSTMTANYHCDGKNPPEWKIHRVGGFLEFVRNKRLGNPLSGFTYDFAKGLENYNTKVLILGGSCSSLGYNMQRTYNEPLFKNAEVLEIKEAGHRMNVEKYEEVISVIKGYLKEY